MKSKLSTALAAAGCVLAASPASALTVASHRGAITSSVPGAVLFDDFDSVQNTAIGTITGGLLCSGVDFGCGGTFGTPPAIARLDRLARSTRDLLNVLASINDAGASFKSLNDQWADTTSAHGRLMLVVLGGLAEFERSLILARTSEGRKRAQARGVKFGRKPKVNRYRLRKP